MQTLKEFISLVAEHIAHERGWPIEDAARWVDIHTIDAREEYHKLGAPLGGYGRGIFRLATPTL